RFIFTILGDRRKRRSPFSSDVEVRIIDSGAQRPRTGDAISASILSDFNGLRRHFGSSPATARTEPLAPKASLISRFVRFGPLRSRKASKIKGLHFAERNERFCDPDVSR